MCHSAGGSKAWIKLDLGTAVSVVLVKIYNRADTGRERFGEHVIETSLDNLAWKTCGTYTLPSSYGPYDESCEVASARYVRLRKTHDGILNLGEVEIYSKSLPGGTATSGGWDTPLWVRCATGRLSVPIKGFDKNKYYIHVGAEPVRTNLEEEGGDRDSVVWPRSSKEVGVFLCFVQLLIAFFLLFSSSLSARLHAALRGATRCIVLLLAEYYQASWHHLPRTRLHPSLQGLPAIQHRKRGLHGDPFVDRQTIV